MVHYINDYLSDVARPLADMKDVVGIPACFIFDIGMLKEMNRPKPK